MGIRYDRQELGKKGTAGPVFFSFSLAAILFHTTQVVVLRLFMRNSLTLFNTARDGLIRGNASRIHWSRDLTRSFETALRALKEEEKNKNKQGGCQLERTKVGQERERNTNLLDDSLRVARVLQYRHRDVLCIRRKTEKFHE